ncbi:MAG: hypothetical protein GDA41_09185 [Rhodospirillales bacterium]|nr:hypothetical protein [Rhodospirillales bacterium]
MEHSDLLEERGILYPLRGITTGTQRNLLYEWTKPDAFDPGQPTWAWLKRTIKQSDCDILLLSSENFSALPSYSRVPARIHRFFRQFGMTVQVFAFFRPQHELLNSMYAQRVRLLNTSQKFRLWVSGEQTKSIYLYRSIVNLWDRDKEFFVTVLPFTHDVKYAGALPRFITAAGLSDHLGDTALMGTWSRRNRTPGSKTVEVFRRLARRGGRKKYWAYLHQIRRFVLTEGWNRGWDRTPFNAVDDALRRRVTRRFELGNAHLANLYFDDTWENTFAAELTKPLSVNEYDRHRSSADDERDIQELVAEVYARFGADPI